VAGRGIDCSWRTVHGENTTIGTTVPEWDLGRVFLPLPVLPRFFGIIGYNDLAAKCSKGKLELKILRRKQLRCENASFFAPSLAGGWMFSSGIAGARCCQRAKPLIGSGRTMPALFEAQTSILINSVRVGASHEKSSAHNMTKVTGFAELEHNSCH
jgi:hypothetical protein